MREDKCAPSGINWLWACEDCDHWVKDNEFEVEECENCGSDNIKWFEQEIEEIPHDYN